MLMTMEETCIRRLIPDSHQGRFVPIGRHSWDLGAHSSGFGAHSVPFGAYSGPFGEAVAESVRKAFRHTAQGTFRGKGTGYHADLPDARDHGKDHLLGV
jgi:hypothetical protein